MLGRQNKIFPKFHFPQHRTDKTIVEYVNVKKCEIEETKIKIDSKYMLNGKLFKYNEMTMDTYRIMRKMKIDPLSKDIVKPEECFEFPYQWDPYTGERKEKDPYGPLCFSVHHLVKFFYTSRLRKLWVDPQRERNDRFQGYYDVGVGAGKKFKVQSRGYHPQWYIFRLPIDDCYLTDEHNGQIVTFGPELTKEELQEIDTKMTKIRRKYKKMFSSYPPSLMKMKKYYDKAIDESPQISYADELKPMELIDSMNAYNRKYVDKLKNM